MLNFFVVSALVTMGGVFGDDPKSESAASSPATTIKSAIGVEFAELESKLRRSLIRTKTPYGFKVRSVEAGSPADLAGVKPGDIVMEWNGQPIRELADLDKALAQAQPGDTAKLSLSRLRTDSSPWSRKPWSDVKGTVTLK